MLKLKANTSLTGEIYDKENNLVASCVASVSNDFANTEPQINIKDYEKYTLNAEYYDEEIDKFKQAFEEVAKDYQRLEEEEREKEKFRSALGAHSRVRYETATASPEFKIPQIRSFSEEG